MTSHSYAARRSQLTTYFDRTAVEAWARLTSDAPVSKIRATVRAGRDAMRANLLSWLPDDLTGKRLLDAGCGTGALSLEAARRGAEVVAIDVSPTLIGLARERTALSGPGRIDFRVGDMLDSALGRFDHIVAMDSLIHYATPDIVQALCALSARADGSVLFTVAPRTPLLTLMHLAGRAFPRSDRAPAIVPVGETDLRRRIVAEPALAGIGIGRTHRVNSGFYLSQAFELTRQNPPPSAGEGACGAGGRGGDLSEDGGPLLRDSVPARPASRATFSRKGEKGSAP
jgi:magnesium-protoporphyrin O-methyltransferase